MDFVLAMSRRDAAEKSKTERSAFNYSVQMQYSKIYNYCHFSFRRRLRSNVLQPFVYRYIYKKFQILQNDNTMILKVI